MHRLILSLLLLPATAMAAETLSNAKLESAYTPEAPACLPGKDKKLPKACEAGSRSVTDKALRDAEQQNTSNILNNPQLSHPDLLPQPTEQPTPTLRQQDLERQLNQTTPTPRSCNGTFC